MILFPQLLSGNWEYAKPFIGLKRRLQTTVEHIRVTNTEVTAMARGELIVLVNGQRQAARANASALGTAKAIGAMCEATAANATGIARTNGYAYVLFVPGLAPVVAGSYAYVSETPGRATDSGAGLNAIYRIGIIGDASGYDNVTGGYCMVYLQRCCVPTLEDRG